ncbi:WXG100 family type VII secretion target [Nocardia sp. Marseille-Q1738]
MAERIELDPDLLRQAAQKTSHVRDRINSVMSTLQTSLAGRGAPWGNDKIGDNFYNGPNGNDGYQASRKNLTTNATNMSTTFGNFSTNQARTADYLERQDRRNADGFRR